MQVLWQAHDEILLIILLKEFIKLNVKINMIIKSAKRLKVNTKTATAFWNRQTLKVI